MLLPELEDRDLAELPIFPLPSATLVPGAALPLHVFEPRYRELVQHVLGRRKLMAVARLKPGFEATYEGRPPVFDVCGVGMIESYNQRPDGRFDLTLRGLARVRIIEELPPLRAFRSVRAARLIEPPVEPALLAAWQLKLRELWTRLAPHLPEPARDLRLLTRDAEGASAYTDRLAAALVADPDASHELLSEADPGERLRLLTARVQELVDALSPRGAVRERALN
jgi:uncharacterized protein